MKKKMTLHTPDGKEIIILPGKPYIFNFCYHVYERPFDKDIWKGLYVAHLNMN